MGSWSVLGSLGGLGGLGSLSIGGFALGVSRHKAPSLCFDLTGGCFKVYDLGRYNRRRFIKHPFFRILSKDLQQV